MQAAIVGSIGTPQPATLRRPERRRARLEDFEMIARTREALALLESKWTVDVIFLLASGIRRHARLVDNAPGLSKKVLTATLRRLEQTGVVSRHVYAEMPVRIEYRLTALGWQLTEPLMALYEWAVEHETELSALNTTDANTCQRQRSRKPSVRIGGVEWAVEHETELSALNTTDANTGLSAALPLTSALRFAPPPAA